MIKDKIHTNITIDQIRQNIRNGVYATHLPADAYPRFKHDCLLALGLADKKNADIVFKAAVKISVSKRHADVLRIMIDLATLLWTVGPTFND